jgi:hypothetical protein
MMISIFWDITPCSPFENQPTFRSNMSSPSSGSKSNPNSYLLSRWLLAWFILRPAGWRRNVPPKRRLTFNGLHGVISQKIELSFRFIFTSSTRNFFSRFINICLFFSLITCFEKLTGGGLLCTSVFSCFSRIPFHSVSSVLRVIYIVQLWDECNWWTSKDMEGSGHDLF